MLLSCTINFIILIARATELRNAVGTENCIVHNVQA